MTKIRAYWPFILIVATNIPVVVGYTVFDQQPSTWFVLFLLIALAVLSWLGCYRATAKADLDAAAWRSWNLNQFLIEKVEKNQQEGTS